MAYNDHYKYDTREVTYGNSHAAYALITTDPSTGLMTFDKPKELTGMVSVSFNKSKNASSIYADDITHMSLKGNTQVSGTIVFYQLEKNFYLKALGNTEHPDGLITDTGATQNFAFMYLQTIHDQYGKETPKLIIYYNISAGAPTGESTTKTDSVSAKQFSLPMTALPNPALIDGQTNEEITTAEIVRDDKNAAFFDQWMDGVLVPKDIAGSVPKGAIQSTASAGASH